MTDEEIRGAVLRHLDWIERLGCQPEAIDEFLALPVGTTQRVQNEVRRPPIAEREEARG